METLFDMVSEFAVAWQMWAVIADMAFNARSNTMFNAARRFEEKENVAWHDVFCKAGMIEKAYGIPRQVLLDKWLECNNPRNGFHDFWFFVCDYVEQKFLESQV